MKRLIFALLFLIASFGFVPQAFAVDLLGSACTAAQEGAKTCTLNGCYTCSSLLWTPQALYVGANDNGCSSTYAGFIRWNGAKFQGCDGTSWMNFGESSANVLMLLHMDGTNGAATFTDSSGYGRTPTTILNAKLSTSILKFGASSGYFNGSSYLQYPDSDDYDFGTSDFTIDFWAYPTACTPNAAFFQHGEASDYKYVFDAEIDGSCNMRFLIRKNETTLEDSTLLDIYTTSAGLTLNAWSHVALVRHGNLFTVYVNGIAVVSKEEAIEIPQIPYPLYLGARHYGGSTFYYYTGYMDEFRITKGTALWTSNFSPPTAASDAETTGTDPSGDTTSTDGYNVLLLHMNDGTFTDYSQSAHAVTINGAAATSVQSRFGGVSGYFGGSSYLQFADSTDWYFASGNFTIDAWIYPTSCSDDSGIYSQGETASALSVISFELLISCKPRLLVRNASTDVIDITSSSAVTLNVWSHVAVVRSGSTVYLFINGTLANSKAISAEVPDVSYPVNVGRRNVYGTTPSYFSGYIDELRVSKGIARWTTTFIPPTASYD